ncbi:MAG: methylglyoxal synthase [Saprospiraceae bacterium]|jgi:methylglyoxal synthase
MKVNSKKTIALVAHDNKKFLLIEWLKRNLDAVQKHAFYATGTTGKTIIREIGLDVKLLHSGPLGGDQQIGAKIAEGEIDMLIFFLDPLEAMPHDSDVKALIRLSSVWNIPVACNEATADFLISSPNFNNEYERTIPDFESYKERSIPK